MKKLISTLVFFALIVWGTFAQTVNYIDTTYSSINSYTDIQYGSVTGFDGGTVDLKMDISVPNDGNHGCRPLVMFIHGGAFIGGTKNDPDVQAMRIDFAKRGYVAVSIDYRLGAINSGDHCNVTQLFNIPWDCVNFRDTAEWYRAGYRAMQDAKSALRYLVNNHQTYNIDVENVFLAGTSAGAITAMNAAYVDDPAEKPTQCGTLAAITTSSSSINLCSMSSHGTTYSRPDLGSIDGNGNPTNIPYQIKGIGEFFGCINTNLFVKNSYTMGKTPALFMFHQSNDLVVPIGRHLILIGLSYCLTQFPANCSYVQNTPIVYGSDAIGSMLDTTSGEVPQHVYYRVSSNEDCLQQTNSGSTSGHRIDNYQLRTQQLAQFFAGKLTGCTVGTKVLPADISLNIYPNPVTNTDRLVITTESKISDIGIANCSGQEIFAHVLATPDNSISITLPENLSKGIYFVKIMTTDGFVTRKLCVY